MYSGTSVFYHYRKKKIASGESFTSFGIYCQSEIKFRHGLRPYDSHSCRGIYLKLPHFSAVLTPFEYSKWKKTLRRLVTL